MREVCYLLHFGLSLYVVPTTQDLQQERLGLKRATATNSVPVSLAALQQELFKALQVLTHVRQLLILSTCRLGSRQSRPGMKRFSTILCQRRPLANSSNKEDIEIAKVIQQTLRNPVSPRLQLFQGPSSSVLRARPLHTGHHTTRV